MHEVLRENSNQLEILLLYYQGLSSIQDISINQQTLSMKVEQIKKEVYICGNIPKKPSYYCDLQRILLAQIEKAECDELFTDDRSVS